MFEHTYDEPEIITRVPFMYRRCKEAEAILDRQAAMEAFTVWLANRRCEELDEE